MAQYEIWLCSDRGRKLMPLNNLQAFAATKALNKTVGFSATLKPPTDTASVQDYHYIENRIRRDLQVQIWRKDRGPSRLWQSYLTLKWGWAAGEGGQEEFTIGGYDMSHLLTRRIVAAYAESAQSSMTDYADDMMKAVVRDMLQDDALPVPEAGTRAWADLTVANDRSKGPSIDMGFAWDKILTLSGRGVLPQIASAARAEGTEIYFFIAPNVISKNGVTWQFLTVIDAIHDLTSGPRRVVFDANAGTLESWTLTYDYGEAENYIYAGGQGEADARYIEQVYDAARYKTGYWGRTEGFLDVRNLSDAEVDARALARLIQKRPRISLIGTPVPTAGQVFGRHYDVGDKITVAAKGVQFPAIVQAAALELAPDGAMKETVRLDYRE